MSGECKECGPGAVCPNGLQCITGHREQGEKTMEQLRTDKQYFINKNRGLEVQLAACQIRERALIGIFKDIDAIISREKDPLYCWLQDEDSVNGLYDLVDKALSLPTPAAEAQTRVEVLTAQRDAAFNFINKLIERFESVPLSEDGTHRFTADASVLQRAKEAIAIPEPAAPSRSPKTCVDIKAIEEAIKILSRLELCPGLETIADKCPDDSPTCENCWRRHFGLPPIKEKVKEEENIGE